MTTCRTVAASGTHAIALSRTVYNRRRVRAGSSLFVQRSLTSVGHRARSCSGIWMSAVVASGRQIVGSSGTAYGRRHRRAQRLASSMVTERFAVDVSGTFCNRRRLRTGLLASSSVSRRRCRRVGDVNGCGFVRDSLQSTTSVSRTALSSCGVGAPAVNAPTWGAICNVPRSSRRRVATTTGGSGYYGVL